MELTHKGCKGKLNLDLSSIITVRTRSTIFTEDGLSVGVLEITSKDNHPHLEFSCSKCGEQISSKDVEKIAIKCPVCRKEKTIDLIMFTDIFPVICDDCCSILSGEKPVTPALVEVASFFSLPERIKGRPAVELLNKIQI